METLKTDKSKINSYIMAMFLFQFGFIQPFASIVDSQWPVVAFTVLLFGMVFWNNGLKIKRYVVLVFIILSAYFFFNALVFDKNVSMILSVYFAFIVKGFSAFIIGSLEVDGEELFEAFIKLALINFFAIILYPFVDFLDSMDYMRFGYAMTPSVIMFFYAIVNKKSNRLLWSFLFFSSFLVTVIYGSRGTLVVFMLLALLIFILTKKITIIKKISLVAVALTTLGIMLRFKIFIKILDFFYYDLGIKSYSLRKYTLMFSEGLIKSSSGRGEIYSSIIYWIKQNPILGNGIGFSQLALEHTAHNIILQILLESGFPGLLVWSCIWFFALREYRKISVLEEAGLFRIITMLLAISFGRLTISSDMWLRPELWMVLSILLSYKFRGKYLGEGLIK